VTLSHKMLQGHCTQVIVTMVTCQLYSSTVRPMFSHPEKTHQTTATSDCAGMSDTMTKQLHIFVYALLFVPYFVRHETIKLHRLTLRAKVICHVYCNLQLFFCVGFEVVHSVSAYCVNLFAYFLYV